MHGGVRGELCCGQRRHLVGAAGMTSVVGAAIAELMLCGLRAAAVNISGDVATIEKVNMLTDPSYRPSCSINPVLACGSVMATAQWGDRHAGLFSGLLG
jgi:hypothetical protein